MKTVFIILASLFLVSICINGQTSTTSQPKKSSETTPQVIPTPIKNSIDSNPGSDGEDLPKFEKRVLAELNLFRADPQGYTKYIEAFLKTYNGTYFINDEGVELISFEGRTPVIELIAALKQTKPLSEFKIADGMVKAAIDHVRDLVRNNKTGHRGTDGSLPDDRVSKYGTTTAGVNENISYGATTARDIVLTMLIDDGNPSRNHRKNLLNPNFKVIGLATGEIKQAGLTCVLVFADRFTDKPK